MISRTCYKLEGIKIRDLEESKEYLITPSSRAEVLEPKIEAKRQFEFEMCKLKSISKEEPKLGLHH